MEGKIIDSSSLDDYLPTEKYLLVGNNSEIKEDESKKPPHLATIVEMD